MKRLKITLTLKEKEYMEIGLEAIKETIEEAKALLPEALSWEEELDRAAETCTPPYFFTREAYPGDPPPAAPPNDHCYWGVYGLAGEEAWLENDQHLRERIKALYC